MALNKVIIMGRLGADPELRYLQSNVPVARFSLAVDRDFKDKASGQKVTDWIGVVAWRGTAEFAAKYFRKGRVAIVEGRLQTNSYTDQAGNKRSYLEVVADSIYFGDSKTSAPGQPAAEPTGQTFTEESDVDDGQLPF